MEGSSITVAMQDAHSVGGDRALEVQARLHAGEPSRYNFSEDPHQNLKKIPKHVVTSHSTHPIRNYLYLIHSEPQSGLASYPTLSPG
jgi:hypothetical protein